MVPPISKVVTQEVLVETPWSKSTYEGSSLTSEMAVVTMDLPATEVVTQEVLVETPWLESTCERPNLFSETIEGLMAEFPRPIIIAIESEPDLDEMVRSIRPFSCLTRNTGHGCWTK
ncbi:hypothetical protein Lal_00041550 [Lupinus albus]|nr:hypothetical protein Lal_00041550 [Lupinus albus]